MGMFRLGFHAAATQLSVYLQCSMALWQSYRFVLKVILQWNALGFLLMFWEINVFGSLLLSLFSTFLRQLLFCPFLLPCSFFSFMLSLDEMEEGEGDQRLGSSPVGDSIVGFLGFWVGPGSLSTFSFVRVSPQEWRPFSVSRFLCSQVPGKGISRNKGREAGAIYSTEWHGGIHASSLFCILHPLLQGPRAKTSIGKR